MKSVLIVEDSPTQMEVMKKIIQSKGYNVLWAKNGEEAVEISQKQLPNLILMDILMPGGNGFQATRNISRNPKTSNIPIVIISTKAEESDISWGVKQGARQYLSKPFLESELEEVIKNFLE